MGKRKLYTMLGCLNPEDKLRFKEFLTSPLYNNRGRLVELYDLIISPTDPTSEIDWENEALWQNLFPSKPYNRNYLDLRIHQLLEKLKEFLAVEELLQSPWKTETMAKRAFLRRGIDSPFQSKGGIKESKEQNSQVARYQYRLELELIREEYLNSLPPTIDNQNYSDCLLELDRYSAIMRLKIGCLAANHDQIYATRHAIPHLRSFAKILEQSPPEKFPLLHLYFHALGTLVPGRRMPHFDQLRSFFANLDHQANDQFHPEELFSLFTYAVNFCIRETNKGSQEFFRHLYSLYGWALEFGWMETQEGLPLRQLKNILTLFCRLGMFDEAWSIFGSYRERLQNDPNDIGKKYCEAILHYSQENFREAIRILHKINFQFTRQTDLLYILELKVLLCRVYGTLGEFDQMHHHAILLLGFLSRNQSLSNKKRAEWEKVVLALKKYAGIRMGKVKNQEKKLDQLAKELKPLLYLSDIKWLINELKPPAK